MGSVVVVGRAGTGIYFLLDKKEEESRRETGSKPQVTAAKPQPTTTTETTTPTPKEPATN